jgi:hypothetical protein
MPLLLLTVLSLLCYCFAALLQIARITAGTSVSPAGFFEVDSDAEPLAIKVQQLLTATCIVITDSFH